MLKNNFVSHCNDIFLRMIIDITSLLIDKLATILASSFTQYFYNYSHFISLIEFEYYSISVFLVISLCLSFLYLLLHFFLNKIWITYSLLFLIVFILMIQTYNTILKPPQFLSHRQLIGR
jgi:hypothetical protein